MFPDLVTPVYELKRKAIKRLPCHSIRASGIGDLCERKVTYSITNWADADLPDIHLQLIFMEGDLHERDIIRSLQDAGFKIIEQQTALEWKDLNITAHPDAVVVVDDRALPLDAKSMSGHIWDGIFRRGSGVYSWEEVKDKFTKPWLRCYCAQITIYAILKECEEGGILIFKNKSTGALAQVNVPLDLEYGEQLLKRAERVNRHVKEGTLPDRIPWDEEQCGGCRFLSICLPDRVGKDPLVFLEDSAIVALLEERAKLEESGREYDAVDKRFKAWAKARPESKISIGRWLVTKTGGTARTIVKVEAIS